MLRLCVNSGWTSYPPFFDFFDFLLIWDILPTLTIFRFLFYVWLSRYLIACGIFIRLRSHTCILSEWKYSSRLDTTWWGWASSVALAFITGCVALLEDVWYLASSRPTASTHGDLAFSSTRVVLEDVACRRLVCTVRRGGE
jgi:hypothetical protein